MRNFLYRAEFYIGMMIAVVAFISFLGLVFGCN